jgi:hypothetical protein
MMDRRRARRRLLLLVLTDPLVLNMGVAATGTGRRGTPKQKLKRRLPSRFDPFAAAGNDRYFSIVVAHCAESES